MNTSTHSTNLVLYTRLFLCFEYSSNVLFFVGTLGRTFSKQLQRRKKAFTKNIVEHGANGLPQPGG